MVIIFAARHGAGLSHQNFPIFQSFENKENSDILYFYLLYKLTTNNDYYSSKKICHAIYPRG